MRRPVLLSFMFLWAAGVGAFAVENGPLKVMIVRAEQKEHDRVMYWQVDTPLYREDPYFEVTVRAGRTVLVGEYEPRNAEETLPAPWRPGAVVPARIEKHHLYLERPNGSELRFEIVKRTAARSETSGSGQ